MITIKDVAKAAGVSAMTASRVVNNKGNVNEDAKRRVRQAVDQLGYVRNSAASSLRNIGAPTWTVGLILNDVGNPFSAEIHRAVEDVVRGTGSLVLTASTDEDQDGMVELIDQFWSRRIDGLILAPPPGSQDYLNRTLERGLPIVLVDRPAVGIEIPAVLSNGFAGLYEATGHLITGGHTKIGFLGDTRSLAMESRFEGYQERMKDEGLPLESSFIRNDVEQVGETTQAVKEMLVGRDCPTALITARNTVTIGAVRALHQLKKQHEVALIGFDDLDLAEDLEPGLTVVAQDPYAIGQLAAQTLLSKLARNEVPNRGTTVPTRLIPRGSGEIPPLRG